MWTCAASVLLLILCSTTHATTRRRHGTSHPHQIGSCGLKYFRCDSGECIDEDNLCDGQADCTDSSDEMRAVCWDIPCPKFLYRCNYGACIKSRGKCNGVKDCLDGSDEASCGFAPPTTEYTPWMTTTHTRPIPSRPIQPVNCLIPNDPDNGMYTIGGTPPDMYITGEVVPPYSVLVTNCNVDYQISPANNKYSVCANGIWTPLPSTCSRFSQPTNEANPAQCHCYC